MRVRNYRVFCIDREEGVNDLIKLIKSTPASKMALVIQNGFLLLNSEINLKLIKDYAKRYGKEIVFINPDPFINEKVSAMGFKIYPNLEALQLVLPFSQEAAGTEEKSGNENKGNKEDWSDEKPVGEENHLENGKRREKKIKAIKGSFSSIFSMILILIILGLAYFYFLYPTATIEIKPIVNEIRDQLQVTGSNAIQNIDWENNILPLHRTEMEITGKEELKTTGVKLVGETPARGTVKFINESQEAKKIPAGTIVKTESGNRFKTLKEVTVSGLEVDYLMDVPVGMKAGQAEVEVEALVKGSKGNISIGRIRLIENELDKVHVINPEPIRGGEDKRIAVVSEDDVIRVKEILEEKLKNKLVTEFYQEMGGNYRIIEKGLTYKDLELSVDHNIGDVTDTIKAEGRLIVSGHLLKNSELDRLVTHLFQNELPENYQLMSTGINIRTIKLEEKETNLYNIELELQAPVIPVINRDHLARQLMGMKLGDARQVLQERTDIKDFYINSRNETLPRVGFALKVIIAEPEDMRVFRFNE